MEKISWIDKVTNEEVLRRVNKDRKYWTLFVKGNIDGLAGFWDTTDFCMKLLKEEWEVNQQE